MEVPLASWLLLVLSVLGALLALPAALPGRHLGWGNVFWFLAGFLTAELALFHIVLGAVVLAALTAAGALRAWPGQAGLVLVVLSCVALAVVQWRARPTAALLEAALREGLGTGYRSRLPPERLAAVDVPVGPELRHPFRFDAGDVEVIRDVRYDAVHARHRLDVYRPRTPVRGAPVLLQVHGGAWQFGQKEHQGLPLMHFLAARGWVCVATNYRLCPHDRFPAALLDCKRALAWIRGRVAEYGGDPSFVVVTGGSAGGHLASLLALTPNRPELQAGFEHVDTRVSACVPFYGVYDFLDREQLRRDGGKMTDWLHAKVMPCRPEEDAALWDVASPIAQVRPDAPPFFVLHGTYDSLAKVEEARAFVARLRAVSRAPVAYAELPAAQHAWDLVHSVRADHSVRAVARFVEWVRAEHAHAGG